MKPCLLFLSCKNIDEADRISYQLLKEKLIVCAKKIPINSTYLWKNKIESDSEILLIIDSIEENFKKINEEIEIIHSYKVYNLLMVKVDKINSKSLKWLTKSAFI
ncbi:Divalent-cation tolerance protein CutA [Candidatus Roizmanbacteria bacterium]|nr:Divalent-cation tolerance protein CutA [Candidatus Roizmanbacteria bacterium]